MKKCLDHFSAHLCESKTAITNFNLREGATNVRHRKLKDPSRAGQLFKQIQNQSLFLNRDPLLTLNQNLHPIQGYRREPDFEAYFNNALKSKI